MVKNGLFVVMGEMSAITMAMKKGTRWSGHGNQEYANDPLIRRFHELKDILSHINDLSELDPNTFLAPFLEVIRSQNTTGPVTGLALSSVNKFLSYGLIPVDHESATIAIENITDAVTRARFVCTEPGSDEVVLMKILLVLRTLIFSPLGLMLSNEAVCEIMQSCFRFCFEIRLSDLLRKTAEHSVTDMVQLLFTRLPQFIDDGKWSYKKLKMRTGSIDPTSRGSKRKTVKVKSKRGSNGSILKQPKPHQDGVQYSSNAPIVTSESTTVNETSIIEHITPNEGVAVPESVAEFLEKEDTNSLAGSCEDLSMGEATICLDNDKSELSASEEFNTMEHVPKTCDDSIQISDSKDENAQDKKGNYSEYVNPRGVRFLLPDNDNKHVPYGLPCVRELFRFLVSLINPTDKNNTDIMLQIGLNLLTVAMETGGSAVGKFTSLLILVKDEMCKHLIFLLNTEKLGVFASSIRLCFLLFEALRLHTKFQLEMCLMKLMTILVSDSPKIMFEQKMLILECFVQLWRIPGLSTELYLNYDCDLYCSNLFEDLIKLLAKSVIPVSGVYLTNWLALDALLAVVDNLESRCNSRILMNSKSNTDPDFSSEPSSEGSTAKASGEDASDVHVQPPAAAEVEKVLEVDLVISPKECDPPLPTVEMLKALKNRKKLLIAGSEQFNQKPAKGIQFLQENNLLSYNLEPEEIVQFLRNNPKLDKKQIGDFISNRKNLRILDEFVRSFSFEDTRIDEALRLYLEAFRLPGEAPVISLLLEHFADHWHKSNGSPFANSDAAFTLSYAVIMLNVDQHNHNVKKQNNPMNLQEFRKNVSKVNGGQDFDQDMLEEIYHAIRGEEIVMPAEHTGLVREEYLWKVLLRRGTTKDGIFLLADDSDLYDVDIFNIMWGPTVNALSFVYEKSTDDNLLQLSLTGFRKCSAVAAHFALSDVFDSLVSTLSKFTNLLNCTESADLVAVNLGSDLKAMHATKIVFSLAHRHGDILRDGWKNILDCLLQMYKSKLLPEILTEAEDFVHGRVSLLEEEKPFSDNQFTADSGLFSSFYSFITSQSDGPNTRIAALTQEDKECIQVAADCVEDCHPEQLITESKFLRVDSLQELVKSLVFASQCPETGSSNSIGGYDEKSVVFFLELLVKIVLQNRDRVTIIWTGVRDHLYGVIMAASAGEHIFLLERAVVGLLHLAIRLLRREDLTAPVLQSLRMLLLLKMTMLQKIAKQVSFALYELLKTNAANIHVAQDWSTIFMLLECVGAGAKPPKVMSGVGSLTNDDGETFVEAQSDNDALSDSEVTTKVESVSCSDRGYTSDSELYESSSNASQSLTTAEVSGQTNREQHHRSSLTRLREEGATQGSGWILVGKEGEIETLPAMPMAKNQYRIALERDLDSHDPLAFSKSCESLAFLIRDVAHITPENFEFCVHCVRTFVEASLYGSVKGQNEKPIEPLKLDKPKASGRKSTESRLRRSQSNPTKLKSPTNAPHSSPGGDTSNKSFETMSEDADDLALLLDLMHTLHTRAAGIFNSWAQPQSADADCNSSNKPDVETTSSGNMWDKCWCPLLQGIACMCCDSRREIRMLAMTYLQRALLIHDMQVLTPTEWESCFNTVLFPLLARLLESSNKMERCGLEETRMRIVTLLCKVFLQHLSPLLQLPTFTALWLTILDFMDKYMHAEQSDMLLEAIPELLKNMLLVMVTAGIFECPDTGKNSQLWMITWDRLDICVPGLRDEIFKSHQIDQKGQQQPHPVPETIAIEATDAVLPTEDENEKVESAEETHASMEDLTGVDNIHDQISIPEIGTRRSSLPLRHPSNSSPPINSSLSTPTRSISTQSPTSFHHNVILQPPLTDILNPASSVPLPVSFASINSSIVPSCDVTTASSSDDHDGLAGATGNIVPLMMNPASNYFHTRLVEAGSVLPSQNIAFDESAFVPTVSPR